MLLCYAYKTAFCIDITGYFYAAGYYFMPLLINPPQHYTTGASFSMLKGITLTENYICQQTA
ncbi:hypothetical protein DYH52_14295 [Morganella morganii]|nr:hypothetical protein CO693_13410 [Morganella morganii]EBR9282220.1 hypothetical protein [Salmonella enterica subsp. enterica serovar Neukoelln]EBV1760603.1 hypothetical protein [Salmonella enterica subsp. enterica serovar Newport]EMP53600.1 hypothetical protein C790_00116 [Morganella morganii SC01]RTY16881.1 hypothetical protein EKS23_18870 [Morganella morganii subsp. morganii]CDK67517.1 hypothetical protein [Morganella morganii IS15]